jgi:hypothetical protein
MGWAEHVGRCSSSPVKGRFAASPSCKRRVGSGLWAVQEVTVQQVPEALRTWHHPDVSVSDGSRQPAPSEALLLQGTGLRVIACQ